MEEIFKNIHQDECSDSKKFQRSWMIMQNYLSRRVLKVFLIVEEMDIERENMSNLRVRVDVQRSHEKISSKMHSISFDTSSFISIRNWKTEYQRKTQTRIYDNGKHHKSTPSKMGHTLKDQLLTQMLIQLSFQQCFFNVHPFKTLWNDQMRGARL